MIDLSHNQLSELPEDIGQLKTLKKLDLRSNQFAELPLEISELKVLKRLDLRNNTNLNNAEIEKLRKVLPNCVIEN